jgi:hypothetical protein
MNLADLFGTDEPYSVQTWQFNGPDRVCALGERWDTIEEAVQAASEWTGVPENLFHPDHAGFDRDKLSALSYKQKIGLVIVSQGDRVVRTAPLDGDWMPDHGGKR